MASQLPIASTSLTTSLQHRSTSSPLSTSLLFIDAGVSGSSQIAAAAQPGTEVHLLVSQTDAIAQITQVLAGRSGIESVQIVSHGGNGSLDFAAGSLNLASLPSRVNQLKSWSAALTADADILLYGCDVAQDSLGQGFVNLLAQATGADVAASKDVTGFGGNWDLEFQTGRIESSALRAIDYAGTLGNFTVNNTDASGSGSLTQALVDARSNADADTITFDFANNATINLDDIPVIYAGMIVLNAGEEITFKGVGNGRVTLQSSNAVFKLEANSKASFQDLNIYTTGRNDCIYNEGTITQISNSIVKIDSVSGSGWNSVLTNYGSILRVDDSMFQTNGRGSALQNYSLVDVIQNSHFAASSVTLSVSGFSGSVAKINQISNSSIFSSELDGIYSSSGSFGKIENTTIRSKWNAISIDPNSKIENLLNCTLVSDASSVLYSAGTISNLYNTAILTTMETAGEPLTGITNQGNNYNNTFSNSGLASWAQVSNQKTFAYGLSRNANTLANLIDKGNSSKVPSSMPTDQAGRSRIQGSAVDIGAVELKELSRQAIVRNETTGEVAMQYYEGMKLVETKQIFNGSVSASNVMSGVNKDWQLKAVHDFNNDGNADALWQHNDGSTYIWEMKDNVIANVKSLFYTPNGVRQELNAIGPWTIIGLGSQSNDPAPNDRQLLLQNKDTGKVYTWNLNGYEVMSNGSGAMTNDQGTILQPGGVWKAVQMGDFNGDGFANDVLFHNQSTGSLGYWATQNNFVTEIKEFGTLALNGNLSLIGAGRYTLGTQNTQLLMHDRSTGELIVDRLTNLELGKLTTKWMGATAAMGKPTAFNDLNGDGKVEAFWVNADGKFAISTLDATANTSTTASDTATGLTQPIVGWQVNGVGQFVKPDNSPLVQPSFNLSQSILETRSNRTIAQQIIQDFYPGTGDGSQTLTRYNVTVASGQDLIKAGTTATIDASGKLMLTTTNTANATGNIVLSITATDSGATNNTSMAKTLTIVVRPTNLVSKEVIARNESTGEIEMQYFNGIERFDRKSIYLGSVSDANKISGLTKDWHLKASHDFTGDGRTDLLWQNTNGKLVLWEMNDNVVTQSSDLFYTENGNTMKLSDMGDWQVIGMGTQKMGMASPSPIVMLQNRATGEMANWQMNGKEVLLSGSGILKYEGAIAKPGKDWKAIQISDIDADGNSDVILQNQMTGDVYLWSVKDNAIVTSKLLGNLNPSNAWSIVGTESNLSSGYPSERLTFQNRLSGELVIGSLKDDQIVKTGSIVKAGNVNLGNKIIFGSLTPSKGGANQIFFSNSVTGKTSLINMRSETFQSYLDSETNLGEARPGWEVAAIVDTKTVDTPL